MKIILSYLLILFIQTQLLFSQDKFEILKSSSSNQKTILSKIVSPGLYGFFMVSEINKNSITIATPNLSYSNLDSTQQYPLLDLALEQKKLTLPSGRQVTSPQILNGILNSHQQCCVIRKFRENDVYSYDDLYLIDDSIHQVYRVVLPGMYISKILAINGGVIVEQKATGIYKNIPYIYTQIYSFVSIIGNTLVTENYVREINYNE